MTEAIAAGVTVRLAYRLLASDGRVIEERTPEFPLVFLHGAAAILPVIERALEGKSAGHCATLRLSPCDAYGEYDPSLVVDMPRSGFPANVDLVAGAKFNTQGPDGKPVVVRVLDIDGENVSLDGNHPLAGVELTFEFTVLDVESGVGAGAIH